MDQAGQRFGGFLWQRWRWIYHGVWTGGSIPGGIFVLYEQPRQLNLQPMGEFSGFKWSGHHGHQFPSCGGDEGWEHDGVLSGWRGVCDAALPDHLHIHEWAWHWVSAGQRGQQFSGDVG